jgi:uncharacterized protein
VVKQLITFHSEKDKTNLAKHGVRLAAACGFDWDTATYDTDARKDYGEHRIIGTGFIGERLHVMVFVMRHGVAHIISLRKANSRERKKHEKDTTIH